MGGETNIKSREKNLSIQDFMPAVIAAAVVWFTVSFRYAFNDIPSRQMSAVYPPFYSDVNLAVSELKSYVGYKNW